MSKMKKIASLLLAMVMVCAMSVTAMAADITITGAEAGHTYTAYQIFKGTLYEGVLSDIEWGDDVDGGALLNALQNDDTLGTLFAECETAADVAEVLASDEWTAAYTVIFAEIVADCLTGSGTSSAESSAPYTITGLEDDYYLVVDTVEEMETGDAISRYIIQVAGENVSVATKSTYPNFDKSMDDTDGSVYVGQTVTFTLTSVVPDTTGYSEYTYVFSDTMGAGLTFDGISTVMLKIDGTEYEIPSDALEAIADEDGNVVGFTLTLDMTKYQALIGKAITITYTATVNEDAVNTVTANDASLTYNNNPNDSTSTGKFEDEEKVYSAQIVIDKYDGDDSEQKLDGATFVLYKYAEDGTTKLYYVYDEEDGVSWTEDKSEATSKTTDENGTATFIGLENGTYYLEETEAPDGYNTLSEDKKITINGSSEGTGLSVTAEIANESGSTLPSTGGIGTTIFYIVGTIMVLGAVVLLITRKRMSKAE